MHHSFLLVYNSIQLPGFIVSNVISIKDNYIKNPVPRASTKAAKTADLICCFIDYQWIKPAVSVVTVTSPEISCMESPNFFLTCKYDNNWTIKTGVDSEIELHMLEYDVYCVQERKLSLTNLVFQFESNKGKSLAKLVY